MSEPAATEDIELLRQFTCDHSQAAFTELVQRHVNLVYSAALRQVRSPQLAEEIAQSTFADLARNAAKLTDANRTSTVLIAWLYQVARHTAVDVIRKESRRQMREQLAHEMNITNAPDASWLQIEPLLDEAVAALDETDRAAVLLRYFENQSLRDVGQQLGVSDDTAQKRVSRAVERLQEFFAKRGVSVGAGGLVVVISANAVQAAPVGLAVTISTAALAGTAATTSTLIAATTKTIAMTTLQKTLVTATVAVLAGAGIYEARQAAQLRDQVHTLQQRQAPLAEQVQHLQNSFADATNRLADLWAENSQLRSNPNQSELLKLRGEVTQLKNTANNLDDAPAKKWLARVNKLRERLEQNPSAKIPEFQFLDDQDWFSATSTKLDSDADYRRASAQLRNSAKNKFANRLQQALRKYLKENNDVFPTDAKLLQPYFEPQVGDEMLTRWAVLSSESVPNMRVGKDWIITEKSPIDDVFDSRITIGANGFGASDYFSSEIHKIMAPVWDAFEKANNGQEASDPSLLVPYTTTVEQREAIEKLILRKSAGF